MAILLLASPGCGKKGPPMPPDTLPPSVVCHLKIAQEDGKARLTWSQSGCKPGGQVVGFYVFLHREKADKPFCQECPLDFQKVATVHVAPLDPWKTEPARAVHVESLKKGFRYVFMVTAFGPGGQSSDSDYMIAEY